ncbi:hypothetical protein RVR_5501 [Actinacidiphila reveromycinica]|uniref:Uncharacterized protein n=1 Tax=Actinacidiphila reveromycinica TaxID=659352 RepID=A0A7U3URI7_9ACTN|nr:hypothetical protein [Streptomyces sp. SN-593]BBA99045.1 hypothetical protein RVR_5501 [Streptomyces sp. SN-593]
MNPAVPSPTALPAPESDGTARSLRQWLLTTTTGEQVSGHLPPWATEDPSEQEVPAEELAARLADVCHYREFPGQVLRAYSPGNSSDAPEELEVMSSSITCAPYAPAPELALPVVTVRVAGEYWMTDLDPTGVADLVAGLRAVADRLDSVVIPQLNTIRTEWTAHHTSGTGARL